MAVARTGYVPGVPSISRSMTAPPEVAWRLLTDLDSWPQWGPSITSAAIDPRPGAPGPDSSRPSGLWLGARGTVRTVVGLQLPFEVTAFEEGRRWAWAVAGVPATDHRVAATSTGCVVTFGVPWWAPGYLAVCALALRRIESLAGSVGA